MDGLVTGMDEKEWMGEVNEVSEEIKNTIPAVSTVGETPTRFSAASPSRGVQL